jgi:hypothetical protein
LTDGDVTNLDMWRVSGDGFASVIKGWWEDSPHFKQTPQTCLSPLWLGKEVAGCVLFACAFANSFEAATAVSFRCEWTGLKGRRPFDHGAVFLGVGYASDEERRVSNGTISLAEMNGDWKRPAAALLGPVARAVGLGGNLTAEWLAQQEASWARQP